MTLTFYTTLLSEAGQPEKWKTTRTIKLSPSFFKDEKGQAIGQQKVLLKCEDLKTHFKADKYHITWK